MFKQHALTRAVLTLALVAGGPSVLAARTVTTVAAIPAVSALELLQASDRARGGDINGLSMESMVTADKNGIAGSSYTLLVESDQNNSLVTFLAPARSKGNLMLIQGRNMWFLSSDVKKPVPISPRQRLVGAASNGDIATTSYSRDYDAKMIGEADIKGRGCYVLALTAKGKDVTYDQITYYIDKQTHLGLKAEYYTVSGKILKAAYLEYGNRIEYGGRTVSFVSRMEIYDELEAGQTTTLTYSNIKVKNIPSSRFNLNLLRN